MYTRETHSTPDEARLIRRDLSRLKSNTMVQELHAGTLGGYTFAHTMRKPS